MSGYNVSRNEGSTYKSIKKRLVTAVTTPYVAPSQPHISYSALPPAPLARPVFSLFLPAAAMASGDNSKQRSEEEWRAVLSPEQFRILRQKGTESVLYPPPPFP